MDFMCTNAHIQKKCLRSNNAEFGGGYTIKGTSGGFTGTNAHFRRKAEKRIARSLAKDKTREIVG